MNKIKDHLDHLDQLEVATYGDPPSSCTVECTRCGEVVHDFHIDSLPPRSRWFVLSCEWMGNQTFALVHLTDDLTDFLFRMRELVMEQNKSPDPSIKRMNIGLITAERHCWIKDYEKLTAEQLELLHEQYLGESPPDGFTGELMEGAEEELLEFPGHTHNGTLVVEVEGIRWEAHWGCTAMMSWPMVFDGPRP